jgi:hypothetical protein
MRDIVIRRAWRAFIHARAKARLYPRDAHKLPRMEGNYICFPHWCWRNDLAFRVCVWIGDTFNGERYCFTVDRNRDPQ